MICVLVFHAYSVITVMYGMIICGTDWCDQERIMKEGRGGGKEREAPTHLIEISALTHAARVTKNSQTARYVAKKSMSVAVFVILRSWCDQHLTCINKTRA